MRVASFWEPVIGLELHVQLATRSKIFSGASTAFGGQPNTQACEIDLGLPGILPVLNVDVVRMAVMFGLAVDADISRHSVFARKNYFYPDLPKGYQISQYEQPIVCNGHVDIRGGDRSTKRIRLIRTHLEEDAGKSLHDAFPDMTGIDFNRAGTPLLEIVSHPDMRSAAEAVDCMRAIHSIVVYLGICDGNMQEGSLRCDANVSIRRDPGAALGTRTELKNLNSFRFVERAINLEIERQIDVLDSGGRVLQETRHFDEQRDETRPMRDKEEANDYRYFPDPDLLPIELSEEYIASVRATLPELPAAKRARFTSDLGLSDYDAELLTASRDVAEYFEACRDAAGGYSKQVANWMNGEMAARLNRGGLLITGAPVSPVMLGGLVRRIEDGTLSAALAKQVMDSMWSGQGTADEIIAAKGLEQLSDRGEIERLVEEVIRSNPDQAAQYRAGKTKVMGFFVGQIMKATAGKANPRQVNELLRHQLDARGEVSGS